MKKISDWIVFLIIICSFLSVGVYFGGYRRGFLGFHPYVQTRIGRGIGRLPAKERYIWYNDEIIWSSFDEFPLNDSIENQREKDVQYIIHLITKAK